METRIGYLHVNLDDVEVRKSMENSVTTATSKGYIIEGRHSLKSEYSNISGGYGSTAYPSYEKPSFMKVKDWLRDKQTQKERDEFVRASYAELNKPIIESYSNLNNSSVASSHGYITQKTDG